MLLAATVCAAKVIATLASALRHHYVFAPAGSRLAAAIEAKHYAESDDAALAAALTRDLREISGDEHLFVSEPKPPQPHQPRAASKSDPTHGFARVEILPGDIGYLDLRAFGRPDAAATERAAAAFATLKSARAVIIDLRANGGGNPGMVSLVSSYVLDKPTLLAQMHHREGGDEPLWSSPRPANALPHGVPLYLLTSHHTFSAGEGFAFILQHLGRAIVVGERTAGAAHAGRAYPLACGFEAVIPNTSVVLPGTNEDWEGRGVRPDVPVDAAEALDVATELAAGKS